MNYILYFFSYSEIMKILCIDLLIYISDFIGEKKIYLLKVNKKFYKFVEYYLEMSSKSIINPIIRISTPKINFGTIAFFYKGQISQTRKYVILSMIKNNDVFRDIFEVMNEIHGFPKNTNINNIQIHLTELLINNNIITRLKKSILNKKSTIKYLKKCARIKKNKNKKIYLEIGNNHEYYSHNNLKNQSLEIFVSVCREYF
jgi:hypothetical protein